MNREIKFTLKDESKDGIGGDIFASFRLLVDDDFGDEILKIKITNGKDFERAFVDVMSERTDLKTVTVYGSATGRTKRIVISRDEFINVLKLLESVELLGRYNKEFEK